MIGCNGDCDNCDKDDVKRRRQEIINKLNDKAADWLELAKSFKEATLAEQRELIFEKVNISMFLNEFLLFMMFLN